MMQAMTGTNRDFCVFFTLRYHIERVWKLSKTIALKEGLTDTEVVEIAALLHDVKVGYSTNSM
jgi:HD superfamily phosphodiesterase